MAISSVKNTRIVEARLGSTSRNMMRSGPAPCARAASTNSFSRSDSTCPRTGRAMYGMYTQPDHEDRDQQRVAADGDRPQLQAAERQRHAERHAEDHHRERPENVEQGADHGVRPAAEETGDECRGPPREAWS